MNRKKILGWRRSRLVASIGALLLSVAVPAVSTAQVSSVSAWDAADFRVWGYIPYWASASQISGFASNGMYGHVSDVLYFGAVRPDGTGALSYGAASYQTNLNTLRSQSASSGFKLHLSMMAVTGGLGVDGTWLSISGNPTYRQNFVNNLKTLMLGGAGTADDIKGFNFDWERPDLASEWGNYTQLARELRAAFDDPGTPSTNAWEVSVCDYGSTDANWDDTALFDAKVYDQLMMMVYHIGATSSGTWANTKLTLDDQGAAKAFSDNQIAIGFGTWGTDGPATVALDDIVGVNPSLAYDALTFTGTVDDINGVSRTGTWDIESRKQVREKTQLALDRGMPGMFSWTLHYDASNSKSLHRVIHHYTMVQTDTPDLNLDGKVTSADATTLANNMGMVLANTGKTSALQFENFYANGNWEQGDHDGNGFVNQADADWLKARYTALNVALPDRLAYSGTFESLGNSIGVTGRWRAGRDGSNNLRETSNFKQEATNFLTFTGTGIGATRKSNNFVTIRNQNASETSAGLNNAIRSLDADLTVPIDLSQSTETFFTFLVRENTAPLSGAQAASSNRKISLEFLNSSGTSQFDFSILGLTQQLAINSHADGAGQDVTLNGLAASTSTFLVIGKLTGNGAGANTMQASFFPSGSNVGDFTSGTFAWMLSAAGSAGYNPLISDVRFSLPSEANFTISNLWIGSASVIPEPSSALTLIALVLPALGCRRRCC